MCKRKMIIDLEELDNNIFCKDDVLIMAIDNETVFKVN